MTKLGQIGLTGILSLAGLGLATPGAMAQGNPAAGYPNKFIRLIVPYTAGGGTDVVGRVVGEKLGRRSLFGEGLIAFLQHAICKIQTQEPEKFKQVFSVKKGPREFFE